MKRCVFRKANLRNADLREADLRETDVLDAKLEGAIVNKKTKLPFSFQVALEKGMVFG